MRFVARVTPPEALVPVTARASWLSGEAYEARLATEVDVVKRLADNDSPVAGSTLESSHASLCMMALPSLCGPTSHLFAECFRRRLRAGARVSSCWLRQIDVPTPHFMDRVAATQQDVASRDVTPDLAETDRELLASTLRDLSETIANRRAAEQILHGEPHPGNVLETKNGPLFMDFEDSVHGPVEFDLAWVPKEVSERYPDADGALLGEFRGVVLAMMSAPLESRRPAPERETIRSGILNALREGPPWPPHDAV